MDGWTETDRQTGRQRDGYLDDGVTPRRGLDGPPAALCLVVGSVVSFGLDLYLQLILAKLAGQGPV